MLRAGGFSSGCPWRVLASIHAAAGGGFFDGFLRRRLCVEEELAWNFRGPGRGGLRRRCTMRRIFRRRWRGRPRSTRSPSKLMPRSNMMSNSASRKGGAILFFTRGRGCEAPTDVCLLLVLVRRTSMRRRRKTLAPGRREWFRDCRTSRRFSRDLIDEDDRAFGFGIAPGELAECLAHETRLEADVRVAISPSISARG